MAIKVKHEGSVASRLAASASGGSAKRAMEAAALAKPSQIQTLSPAHASAPSAAAPHAQLIPAPGGGAHAPLIYGGGGIGATSRLGGGWGSRSGAATSAQSGGDDEYKVTGSDIFKRPDDASVWDSTTRQWVRRYLPGEKEAEALDRVGTVRNAQQREILDHQHRQRRELAEQSSLLATERDIKGALLKIPPKSMPPAVRAPFATDPGASGEQPELFNRMKEMDPRIIESRDTLDGKELQGPFDNAMAMVLKVISGAGTSMDADPMSPGAPGGSGKLGSMFDSIVAQRGGGAPAVQPIGAADDIAGVYANGGSIFGGQEPVGGDKSLSWLRPTDMDAAAGGGDSVASEAYASSVGGLIDAFMRRNNNYV